MIYLNGTESKESHFIEVQEQVRWFKTVFGTQHLNQTEVAFNQMFFSANFLLRCSFQCAQNVASLLQHLHPSCVWTALSNGRLFPQNHLKLMRGKNSSFLLCMSASGPTPLLWPVSLPSSSRSDRSLSGLGVLSCVNMRNWIHCQSLSLHPVNAVGLVTHL